MFDVIKTYEKVPDEIVKRYAALEESASINESMPNKDGALCSRIHAIWPGLRMCGTALTVQCGIGDNVMLHKAISMAGPGDVVMVTNGDFDEAGGMFGGMMAASLKSRGAAGLVMEGAVRDTMLIKELEFPVFARNVSSANTTRRVCCSASSTARLLPSRCSAPTMKSSTSARNPISTDRKPQIRRKSNENHESYSLSLFCRSQEPDALPRGHR